MKLETSQKPIIVVLGMHRSGTSVTTRIFNLLGANLGGNIMPPQMDNPTGFWEPVEIVAVHDEILHHLGSSWDDPGPLPYKWWDRPDMQEFVEKLCSLAYNYYSDTGQSVIKDPRLCRLMPLWHKVFKKLDWKANYILVGRSPVAVAASLGKRDNLTTSHSYLLWLRYVIESEKWSRGGSRAFVLYDNLLDDWKTEIKRCRKILSLNSMRLSDSRKSRIDDLIDLNLRHHLPNDEDLGATPELSLFSSDVFYTFQQAASDNLADNELQTKMDEISQRVLAADNLYSTVWLPYIKQRDVANENAIKAKEQVKTIGVELENFKAVEADLEHYRELAATYKGESDKLFERTQSLAMESGKGVALSEELDRRREEYVVSNAEMERKLDVKSAQVDSYQREIQGIKENLISKDAELSATKKAMAEQQARDKEQLDKMIIQVGSLQDENLVIKENLISKDAELSVTKKAMTEQQTRDKEQLDKIMIQVGSLQDENLAIKENLISKDAELSATKKAMAEQQTRDKEQLDKIMIKVGSLQDENLAIKENLISKNAELSATKKAMAEQKKRDKEQLDKIMIQVGSLQDENLVIKENLISKDAELAATKKAMAEQQSQLETISQSFSDRLEIQKNEKISLETELQKALASIDENLDHLKTREKEAANGRSHINYLENAVLGYQDRVNDLEDTVSNITSSTSWAITAPLRIIKRFVSYLLGLLKSPFVFFGRWFYHHLPFSQNNRHKIKCLVFKHLPFFLSHTESYRSWACLQQAVNASSVHKTTAHKTKVQNTLVSVVIPVYNNWDYTEKCLESIKNNPPSCEVEVIIVDDFSTDGTSNLIKLFPEVKYFRNEKNSGFIESCNNGAGQAKGDYIFFLNNDTIVTDGWLDELVITFINFPEAGLVGSKLIYPDGRLQEAGGIIWQDGSAWNYGRLNAPDRPEYNYLREVDYVSGAAIMVPKLLFDELGGFDRKYKPAYCEDSDLALKIRARGLSVLYQPLSVVTHFEGISSGTDINSGIKSYQVANSKKLFERWKSQLSSHRANGVDPYLERDRKSDLRILVIDASTPEPDKDAGSVTAFYFMKTMVSDGHRVTFIPADNFAHLGSYTKDLQRVGVECIYAPYCCSVTEYLEAYGQYQDVVFLYRVNYASKYIAQVRTLCPNARIIFDTVDLHYLREERQAEVERSSTLLNQAKKTKALEIDVIEQSDATIVLSDAEKEILSHEVVDADVHVIPLILDIPGCKNNFRDRKGILFIGGFRHSPNVDAVNYFIAEIWPLIRKKRPDIEFTIIGSHPPEDILNLDGDGVNVVGFIDDISEYFNNTMLSVVPLRYGAGIKGKIGTSLSYGVPVIGTTVATEGMGIQKNVHALVEDAPEDFANMVLQLHEDEKLWSSLSAAGLDFVNEQYSIDAGRQKLRILLNSLREVSNE